jgi:hypothetical protein
MGCRDFKFFISAIIERFYLNQPACISFYINLNTSFHLTAKSLISGRFISFFSGNPATITIQAFAVAQDKHRAKAPPA